MMLSSGNWKLSALNLGFIWLPFSIVKIPSCEARLPKCGLYWLNSSSALVNNLTQKNHF